MVIGQGCSGRSRGRKGIDECRAKGCGGWLRGVGDKVYDGEIVYCAACGREHTFHVPVDDGLVRVAIARKSRRGQRHA